VTSETGKGGCGTDRISGSLGSRVAVDLLGSQVAMAMLGSRMGMELSEFLVTAVMSLSQVALELMISDGFLCHLGTDKKENEPQKRFSIRINSLRNKTWVLFKRCSKQGDGGCGLHTT
ncbi:uncharacterized, partial [Tachysurus ichikawai]